MGLAILVAAALAVLLPRVALAFFAFPSADDYCIVVETRQDGFWYMQVHSYLTWTGRYTAVFLESILSQFDIAAMYPWFALSTILATFAGVWAVVAALSGNETSRLRVIGISAVTTAVFVGGLPSTVEAFYWMPGQASYQWGIVTYLVWLALLIRTARRESTAGSAVRRRTALVVMTALVPGFNEVMAPILLATIVGFVVLNRRHVFEGNRFMLALLAIVIVLTIVSFVAPGNASRSGFYPELASRHNLVYATAETARQTARFIARFAAYPALWLGALAAWWWGGRLLSKELPLIRRADFRVGALLGLIAIMYLTLFPVYWEYGEVNYSGEGRTYNVTYLVLCAMVVLVVGLVAEWFAKRFGARIARLRVAHRGADLAIAGALAILLVTSSSTWSVIEALKVAPHYLQEEQARARTLQRSPRTGVVFVDKITVRPSGLFWGDVEPDQSHWINICIAKYYGLDAVRSRT
jgi:hypothetical protein